mmetsp:Transcript_35497/g.75674  ORF Transcript_35497/g.75674 Transcript_35497/m.75674 type:complete len:278 (+) Transcript_35497:733-1566(+)
MHLVNYREVLLVVSTLHAPLARWQQECCMWSLHLQCCLLSAGVDANRAARMGRTWRPCSVLLAACQVQVAQRDAEQPWLRRSFTSGRDSGLQGSAELDAVDVIEGEVPIEACGSLLGFHDPSGDASVPLASTLAPKSEGQVRLGVEVCQGSLELELQFLLAGHGLGAATPILAVLGTDHAIDLVTLDLFEVARSTLDLHLNAVLRGRSDSSRFVEHRRLHLCSSLASSCADVASQELPPGRGQLGDWHLEAAGLRQVLTVARLHHELEIEHSIFFLN